MIRKGSSGPPEGLQTREGVCLALELSAKFVQQGELVFGDLSHFNEGLEGAVALPHRHCDVAWPGGRANGPAPEASRDGCEPERGVWRGPAHRNNG